MIIPTTRNDDVCILLRWKNEVIKSRLHKLWVLHQKWFTSDTAMSAKSKAVDKEILGLTWSSTVPISLSFWDVSRFILLAKRTSASAQKETHKNCVMLDFTALSREEVIWKTDQYPQRSSCSSIPGLVDHGIEVSLQVILHPKGLPARSFPNSKHL